MSNSLIISEAIKYGSEERRIRTFRLCLRQIDSRAFPGASPLRHPLHEVRLVGSLRMRAFLAVSRKLEVGVF